MASNNSTYDSRSDWGRHLDQQLDAIRADSRHPRAWTFDMDDGPELAHPALEQYPTVQRALAFLRAELYPMWQTFDQVSLEKQAKHKRMTRLAIWPGVAAVSVAIAILVLSHVFPKLTTVMTVIELVTVGLAAIAVASGLVAGFHHSWLTARQTAERLRSLKFAALGWHELWCDWEQWTRFVKDEIRALSQLTDHAAEEWAKEGEDEARVEEVGDPKCAVDPAEVAALANYYRTKRLEYQRNYFDLQAHKADLSSWAHRFRVSLLLFAMSVVCVLGHGVIAISLALLKDAPLDAPAKSAMVGHLTIAATPAGGAESQGSTAVWHTWEIILVGLAALLPVIGFGIRAWVSAFEFPRSRNLFRSKSRALKYQVNLLRDFANAPSQNNLPPVVPTNNPIVVLLQTILFSEHFFIGEHREWCRLQTEAEWYF